VKTLLPGAKYDKITMHPSSLRIKRDYMGKNPKIAVHTVAIDARGRSDVHYHREGLGSFRLHTMTRVSKRELHGRVRG
jgi:hypothetical protein